MPAMSDPVDEVESRGAEENKKPEGADYPAIIAEVAKESGLTTQGLKDLCRKRWTMGVVG